MGMIDMYNFRKKRGDVRIVHTLRIHSRRKMSEARTTRYDSMKLGQISSNRRS
jgi:hypothetical protein